MGNLLRKLTPAFLLLISLSAAADEESEDLSGAWDSFDAPYISEEASGYEYWDWSTEVAATTKSVSMEPASFEKPAISDGEEFSNFGQASEGFVASGLSCRVDSGAAKPWSATGSGGYEGTNAGQAQ